MRRQFDIRGYICVVAAGAIQSSVLYRALSASYGDIEIWPSLYESADHWGYYWLVSQRQGVVRGLAVVRYRCDTGQLQEPISGPFGEVSWVDVGQ